MKRRGRKHGSDLPLRVGRGGSDGFFETRQFFGRKFFIAQQRKQEAFAGVSEEAIQDVSNLGAAGFWLADAGGVEKSSALLAMLDIALLLEDADCGEDGVVSQGLALGQIGDEVG